MSGVRIDKPLHEALSQDKERKREMNDKNDKCDIDGRVSKVVGSVKWKWLSFLYFGISFTFTNVQIRSHAVARMVPMPKKILPNKASLSSCFLSP